MNGDDTEPLAGTTLGHEIGFRSEIGRSHRINQDAGGAWTYVRTDGTAATLLVVADGVSAGLHSEEASRLVVSSIQKQVGPALADPGEDLDRLLTRLLDSTREANHEVASRPHESQHTADATTIVAAVCVGVKVAGIWCGDSRAYCLGNSVSRLSRDHSWAEGVVRSGLLTEDQASRDPRAHMITRWLGPPGQDDPGIEVFHSHLNPGQTLMCCSDGLYMYFASPYGREEEMSEVFEHNTGQQGVDELVSIAIRRGGHDDITAAIVRLVQA